MDTEYFELYLVGIINNMSRLRRVVSYAWLQNAYAFSIKDICSQVVFMQLNRKPLSQMFSIVMQFQKRNIVDCFSRIAMNSDKYQAFFNACR